MNLLEEIQNAPVEWKELGEVTILKRGRVMSKGYLEENRGEYPVYSSQTLHRGEIGKITTYDFNGEFLTWTTDGANAGTVFYRIGKFSITNVCGIIEVTDTQEVNCKFLYYYLSTVTKEHVVSGMGNPKLMSNVMAKIKIPIPPLEIQEKIVQTLDKFTDYVTELTLRQKQYSYFRDYLLNFEEDSYKVEWKSLGEVCLSTKTISWKNEDGQKQFKYIDLSSVSRENKKITDVTIITKSTAPSRAQKIIKKDDILFATTRPMLKRFTKVTKEYNYQICSTGFCVLRPSDKILSNYLYHLVASSNFYDYVERNQSGTSYPAISDNLVKNYQFPLPPLSIQEKIVHVLDNFDTVCNDLNIGLPKEIELRQKQYEYFRNQLLTYTAEGVYTDSTVQYRQDLIRLLWYVFGSIKVELGSIAGYSTDKIFNKELTSDTYVGVDNLLQNKLGKKNAVYIPDSGKSTIYLKGDILIGNIRPYLKKIWFATNSGGSSGDVLTVQNHIKDILMSRYLYYLLSGDDFFHFDMQFAKGAKMPRGNKKSIMTYKIPLPPLSIQEKIVQTLDKFDMLTSDLSQGLPKELPFVRNSMSIFAISF